MGNKPSWTGCPLYDDETACTKVKKDRNCYQCKLCEYNIKWKQLKSWHADFDKLKEDFKTLQAENERLKMILKELRIQLGTEKEKEDENPRIKNT